ncbi:DUF952 domain-containing protein [Actinomarinicola tropica]|uniref:DUF952 domain-containing protein n=1 Tax=Actinomarinicola tropica TaxID=2789776 RepID=A0A5Q2RN67_9ACTN|nr:DUF952 domain-containing protein [Actinomarinicola tropica]QGG96392.1 DUF952 domain-containing protein [Actinomarinicola tropica]
MIYHIARRALWDEAVRTGRYEQSTVDRTLAEEGFIHASRAEQVQGVADRYYQDVAEELVLLVIDPDRLDVELRYEAPPGRGESFPHLYGPLDPAAVVEVRPLPRDADGRLVIET